MSHEDRQRHRARVRGYVSGVAWLLHDLEARALRVAASEVTATAFLDAFLLCTRIQLRSLHVMVTTWQAAQAAGTPAEERSTALCTWHTQHAAFEAQLREECPFLPGPLLVDTPGDVLAWERLCGFAAGTAAIMQLVSAATRKPEGLVLYESSAVAFAQPFVEDQRQRLRPMRSMVAEWDVEDARLPKRQKRPRKD
jgi:hypothetical protein